MSDSAQLHADSPPAMLHPGAVLRSARVARGLSQSIVARVSGIPQHTISRLELGQSRASVGTFMLLFRTVLHSEPPVTREYLRDHVPFESDEAARYVVAMHPGGLTGSQIAQVMDLDPRVIDTVAATALAKLRHAAATDPAVRAWVADVLGGPDHCDVDDARAA